MSDDSKLLAPGALGPVTFQPGSAEREAPTVERGYFACIIPAGVTSAQEIAANIRTVLNSDQKVIPPVKPSSAVWKDVIIPVPTTWARIFVPLYMEGIAKALIRPGVAEALKKYHNNDGELGGAAGLAKLKALDATDLSSLTKFTLTLWGADLLQWATMMALTLEPQKMPKALAAVPAIDLAPLRETEKLPELIGGAVIYFRPAFLGNMADRYYKSFAPGGASAIPWLRRTITMRGRECREGHDTAFFGDEGTSYRYTGKSHTPLPWDSDPTGTLAEMREIVRFVTGEKVNFLLANYYRPADSIGPHSDDERDLARGSAIVSVSLGQARTFTLEPKGGSGADKPRHIRLPHGSLLVMAGATQKAYKHRVDPEPRAPNDRVNLTWRTIALL